ncbi:hypothetical protein BCV72DRAFT_55324 [Rhizopus microsporus var. microsporus]|uniref:Uncharacterized protein n=1 Tax=Rhizopus microsporus var. microsporus TaxID=86635 RepID=A0A1X0RCQ0_RHIZD|nr:hypothetical protein BCV72DRAFT_55324 [Rhizopus microsporus var. microsporus]
MNDLEEVRYPHRLNVLVYPILKCLILKSQKHVFLFEMSAVVEEVEALKSKLKEYEKKEASWKEEHAQLLNFQKKLTQAGSHLKALTQENANLSKKMAEEKKQREELSKEINDLKTKLDNTKKGHQKEIKQLVDILETTIDEEHKNSPDVSTSTLLDSYIKSVQKRIPKKAINAPLSQAVQV